MADKRTAHQALTTRQARRHSQLTNKGKNPEQASEMLDLYLSGESVVEIAVAYGLHKSSVYSQIATEALWRMMKIHQAERLEEIKEISEG